MKIPVRTEGDAHARVQVRMEEIHNSIDLILKAVEEAPEGPVDTGDLFARLAGKAWDGVKA